MVIGILAGAVLAIVVAAVRRRLPILRARWHARKATEICPLCDNGRGRELPRRRAHLFVQTFDEGDGYMTGVSVAFCAEHCPGGCTNSRCRAKIDA